MACFLGLVSGQQPRPPDLVLRAGARRSTLDVIQARYFHLAILELFCINYARRLGYVGASSGNNNWLAWPLLRVFLTNYEGS